jgi:hypothetical protein
MRIKWRSHPTQVHELCGGLISLFSLAGGIQMNDYSFCILSIFLSNQGV